MKRQRKGTGIDGPARPKHGRAIHKAMEREHKTGAPRVVAPRKEDERVTFGGLDSSFLAEVFNQGTPRAVIT